MLTGHTSARLRQVTLMRRKGFGLPHAEALRRELGAHQGFVDILREAVLLAALMPLGGNDAAFGDLSTPKRVLEKAEGGEENLHGVILRFD